MRVRKHRIQVRLNEKEYQSFRAKISKCGDTQEVYLRKLISDITPIEKPSKDLLQVIKELRQINNNVNQIAMVANSTHHIDALQYQKNFKALQRLVDNLVTGDFEWR